jgi:hypothetical protein
MDKGFSKLVNGAIFAISGAINLAAAIAVAPSVYLYTQKLFPPTGEEMFQPIIIGGLVAVGWLVVLTIGIAVWAVGTATGLDGAIKIILAFFPPKQKSPTSPKDTEAPTPTN